MPLRDHFHPPVSKGHPWNELHFGWPMMIVRQLYDLLPKGYVAAPGAHLGNVFEVDVAALEKNGAALGAPDAGGENGGVATATAVGTLLTLEVDLPDPDEYEVRIYDAENDRQLVAAIEIVSPSNKDRPESRATFVAKVAALLQRDVCVAIVDLVTAKQFNLYAELLAVSSAADPRLGPTPPPLYAVTTRNRKRPPKRSLLDIWYSPMTLGQPLPTLPLWLTPDLRVLLPLEPGYEETCKLLHITDVR
jgi:hypothetical protein